jgi:MraZ protein
MEESGEPGRQPTTVERTPHRVSSSQGRGLSFTGEFRHTIDAKGRLIVPSRLREQLENDQVVLTPWPEGCIAMWSGEGWRDLETSLLEQRRSDPNQRKVVRALAANAHQDSVDKQGRINVPGHLREFAGIERDCIVIGALDHGEVWSPQRWQQQKAEAAGSLDELTQELNF